MKKIIFILIISLAVTESRGQISAGNRVVVDVNTKGLPKKELVLQDFMDVEYVALETTDVFLNSGSLKDVGNKYIVIANTQAQNGDIFIYDRSGKGLRKINRRGGGGEEYIDPIMIALDEENNELFVNDIHSSRIQVYDLHGKFRRTLRHPKGKGNYYNRIDNYDKNNLICYDGGNERIAFSLISKRDGSVTREIKIPFQKKISTTLNYKQQVESQDPTTTVMSAKSVVPRFSNLMIPYKGNWILSEVSSDIIYTFLRNYSLRPLIERTPSIQTMNPEAFLFLSLISDRYYFLKAQKKIYDFKTKKGFPATSFMYDTQEKAFFEYTVYSADYTNKREVNIDRFRAVNHEIATYFTIEPSRLIESLKKGHLKGKLKEIASTLEEDDNPVIMLVKYKK